MKLSALDELALGEILAHYPKTKSELTEEQSYEFARDTFVRVYDLVRKKHVQGGILRKTLILIFTNRKVSQETAERLVDEEIMTGEQAH